LKRRNLCEKHKQLRTSKVHSDCFIFVVYVPCLLRTDHNKISEASRKSRADLERKRL